MKKDYFDIGQRIKKERNNKGLTQEKLAEIVGIGNSHMSHIENGTTAPSFDVFVDICNALTCSSDILLCKEIAYARPVLDNWLVDLVADCDQTEIKIISDTVTALKATLRKNKPEE